MRLSSISLGSRPEIPPVDELVSFVRTARGREVDLISFYLERSLACQAGAGIGEPCGGGEFMEQRITAVLGTPDRPGDPPADLLADADLISGKGQVVRSALPAPSRFGPPDREEEMEDLCREMKVILRGMRDRGVAGHVLHASVPCGIEWELLGSPKTLFFLMPGREEDIEALLEVQNRIVVPGSFLSMVPDLVDRYPVRRLMVLDPGEGDLKELLDLFEPEKIQVAGYASGDEQAYWSTIREKTEVIL